MNAFLSLLRDNRNYRYTWMGQVVSEIGDHFNNVAVFSLAVASTRSGLVVSGVLLARAIPAVLAGPLAGVMLDRLNRKHVMIASDVIRAIVALGFILTVKGHSTGLLYGLSALLMLASPFFTSGRSAILPSIATREELHTANSLTQTTQWTTLAVGAFLGGASVMQFGYRWAFFGNSLSFVFSALCISRLFLPGRGFRPPSRDLNETDVVRPWHEYVEGLRYMRSVPLILGLAMVNVGWATGGGAAQILFTIFGEMVFNRGPYGLGLIWGCAGVGLVCGGGLAYAFGRRLNFVNLNRFALQLFVVLKEAAQHDQPMRRHLRRLAIGVELRIFGRDRDDLMIFLPRIDHGHESYSARMNNGQRHHGFLAQHEHIERIVVFRESLRDKAVIRGIVNCRI